MTRCIDRPLVDGFSPLHLTCDYGHLAIVECLLAAGSRVSAAATGGMTTATARDGTTPLHEACFRGYADVVTLVGGVYNSCIQLNPVAFI